MPVFASARVSNESCSRLRRVERCLEAVADDFVLLAPHNRTLGQFFSTSEDSRRFTQLLRSAQRFRGEIYLSDGAIERWQLSPDGRYEQAIDYESWHILALDCEGRVCGCARYHEHSNLASFEDLGVRESALAASPWWGEILRAAIENQLAAARRSGVAYVEVGGWAVAPERRFSPEALRLALTTYALAQSLGGCHGITTATVRHRSSAILRKIGGRTLHAHGFELPPYYDPRYRCDMEILQFESRSPGAEYASWVKQLRGCVPFVKVICNPAPGPVPDRRAMPQSQLVSGVPARIAVPS